MNEPSAAEPVCQVPQTWRARLLQRIAWCDTPRRTAAAFALGVFLSFSPFLGLQLVLGLTAAFLLRLSRVALLAGLCMNLPWIMVPWYTATTAAAAAALGTPITGDVGAALGRLTDLSVFSSTFWTHASAIVSPFFWSFIIGSTIGALAVGAGAYFGVVRLVRQMRMMPATAGELALD